MGIFTHFFSLSLCVSGNFLSLQKQPFNLTKMGSFLRRNIRQTFFKWFFSNHSVRGNGITEPFSTDKLFLLINSFLQSLHGPLCSHFSPFSSIEYRTGLRLVNCTALILPDKELVLFLIFYNSASPSYYY